MTVSPFPTRYSYRPTSADLEKIDTVAATLRRAGWLFVTRSKALRFCLDLALAPAAPHGGPVASDATNQGEGVPSITVPLHGLHGSGKIMTLDADVWRAGLAAGWPSDWTAILQPHGDVKYVVCTRRPISPGGKPVLLSRLITGALPGEIVLFRDGDTTNLRASNLLKGTRAEINKFVGERRSQKRAGLKAPSQK